MQHSSHHALDRPLGDASTGRRRVSSADGLRGLAALAIVVHHASFMSGSTFRDSRLSAIWARLDVAVPVFFGLSGYLLFEPMLRRIVEDRPQASMLTFWRRRVVRIFPAYWAALLIQLAIGAIAVGGAGGLLLTLTLTHAYAGEKAITGITQSWSMATEVGFYLLLPFFAMLCAALSRRRPKVQRVMVAAVLAVVCIAISTITRPLWTQYRLPGYRNYRFTVFANADFFAVGLLAACLVVGGDVSDRLAQARSRLFVRPTYWYVASLCTLLFVSWQLDLPRGLAEGSLESGIARQAGYFLVALLAVAPACCAGPTGWGQRLLGSRPFVWLGVVSYGVYLWHQVFISAPSGGRGLLFRLFDWPNFAAPMLPLVILTIAGSLVLGAISWYLLERPLLQRFR